MRRCVWALALCASMAWAGTADEDWQAIIALDAGPQTRPKTGAEAQAGAIAHLGVQERALRGFVSAHPGDAHAFEARLRLARLLALRGDIQEDAKAGEEAVRLLDGIEKSATPEQRPEVEFARLTIAMRRMKKPTATERDLFLGRVQTFQAAHPDDRRLGALLAEVATLFDLQPKIKTKLLRDAQRLARDEELQSRIGDDLRRVEMLGQPVVLAAPGVGGKTVNVGDYRGRVVIVCFFAAWSEPSTNALDALQRAVAAFPKDRVQMLGVSLDLKPEALAALLKEKAITWPVTCDGQGWESPLVRSLGINALPTVWLLDRAGKLRSLNALENTPDQLRQILAER